MPADVSFLLNGHEVAVGDGITLLDALREELGCRSVKDGCSPQGQCGCCTVWVDDAPRVACVTPVRRVAGRRVTTLEGAPAQLRDRWSTAFVAHGASQCGFCTPGIVMRLAALGAPGAGRGASRPRWRRPCGPICAGAPGGSPSSRPPATHSASANPRPAPARRGTPCWRRGARRWKGGPCRPRVPAWSSVAVGSPTTPRRRTRWSSSVPTPPSRPGSGPPAPAADASRAVNSTLPLSYPVEVPTGDWEVTLQTTWVEPAYVEPDASWSRPGEPPASPLANGGAFGGKQRQPGGRPRPRSRRRDRRDRPGPLASRGRRAAWPQAPAARRRSAFRRYRHRPRRGVAKARPT